MTKSIKVNKDTTSSIASGITGASSDIRLSPLASQDGRSTITANKSSKTAYDKIRNATSKFDETITVDAQNIRSLGVKFDEFDRDISMQLQSKAPRIDSMKNFTEEEIRGKLREFENKHDELEYLKRKVGSEIDDEHYFASDNAQLNEQVRYELCRNDDNELIGIIDNTCDSLGIASMQNSSDYDEVRNEVQRHHVRLFDEEDRLYQQLIIAKEAEKQDNR